MLIPWDQTSLYNHHLNLGVAMWNWVLPVLILLYSVASAPHLSWCLPASVIADNDDSFSMKYSGTWCHANGLPFTTQYHKKAQTSAPRPAELYVSTTVRIRGWTCTGSVVEDIPAHNSGREGRPILLWAAKESLRIGTWHKPSVVFVDYIVNSFLMQAISERVRGCWT